MQEPAIHGASLVVVIVAGCLVGGLAGWAAALFARGGAARLGVNVGLGILGALLAGGVLPLLGLGFGGGVLGALLAAAAGAACGLLAVRLVPGA